MINFDLSSEELAVVLTAVATLEEFQRRQLSRVSVVAGDEALEYIRATGSVLEKLSEPMNTEFVNQVRARVRQEVEAFIRAEKKPASSPLAAG